MSNPIADLRDKLERIQLDYTKKAHAEYAKQLELGMNEMVQQIQQAASAKQEEPDGR